MTEHKAVTITKEEAVKDISGVVKDMLKDNVDDLVDGDGSSIQIFEHYSGIINMDIKGIGDMWAEVCSEKFFKKNPKVTDVLLLEKTGDMAVKSWLASK